MIIAVDFDGTIVEHVNMIHHYPQLGQPVPGAIEALKSFTDLGASIILWTMRSEIMNGQNHIDIAVDYLVSNGVNLYGINKNPTQHHWTLSPKAHADLVIDDIAFGCPLCKPSGFNSYCVDWSIVRPVVEDILRKRYDNSTH